MRETPYVTESDNTEEDNSGSDTLDSQLELRSTFGDESRKYKFSSYVIWLFYSYNLCS